METLARVSKGKVIDRGLDYEVRVAPFQQVLGDGIREYDGKEFLLLACNCNEFRISKQMVCIHTLAMYNRPVHEFLRISGKDTSHYAYGVPVLSLEYTQMVVLWEFGPMCLFKLDENDQDAPAVFLSGDLVHCVAQAGKMDSNVANFLANQDFSISTVTTIHDLHEHTLEVMELLVYAIHKRQLTIGQQCRMPFHKQDTSVSALYAEYRDRIKTPQYLMLMTEQWHLARHGFCLKCSSTIPQPMDEGLPGKRK